MWGCRAVQPVNPTHPHVKKSGPGVPIGCMPAHNRAERNAPRALWSERQSLHINASSPSKAAEQGAGHGVCPDLVAAAIFQRIRPSCSVQQGNSRGGFNVGAPSRSLHNGDRCRRRCPLILARVGFTAISAVLLCTDHGVKLEVARLIDGDYTPAAYITRYHLSAFQISCCQWEKVLGDVYSVWSMARWSQQGSLHVFGNDLTMSSDR